jgi:hypothetical protein
MPYIVAAALYGWRNASSSRRATAADSAARRIRGRRITKVIAMAIVPNSR